jgi:thiol-disulfide isomerase/thioredoxin
MDRRTFAVSALGALAFTGCRKDPATVLHGQRLPFVPASLIDGTGINLATLGRPAVLRFWGLWCGPCRIDEPHWDEVVRALKPLQGTKPRFDLLSVHIGLAPKDGPSVPAWAARRPSELAVPIVDDSTQRVALSIGVPGTPLTLLVNANGEIVDHAWAFKSSRGAARFVGKVREFVGSA